MEERKDIEKKRRGGRPKGSGRAERIYIWTGPNEKALLKARAEKLGFSTLQAYVHYLLFSEVEHLPMPLDKLGSLDTIITHLKRCGTNINQIARQYNAFSNGDRITEIMRDRLLKEVVSLDFVVDMIKIEIKNISPDHDYKNTQW